MHLFILLDIKVILKNVGNQTFSGLQWLPYLFIFFLLSKSVGTSNSLVTNFLQNVLFCVKHDNKINTGLVKHDSE